MADQMPPPMPRGVGARVLDRLRVWRPRHRVSLFLMMAMAVALFLGLQIIYVRDNPRELAWFLGLYFVFFLVVIGRAIFEMFDIVREHVRERESAFKAAFGDGEFTSELGRRVSERETGTWPE